MAKKRVWVIDDAAEALEAESEFVPGFDRGPFVVRGRTRVLFCLGILFGPLAVALTRRGAPRLLWTLFAIASTTVWVGTVWRWQDFERWIAHGRIPVVLWSAGMLVMSVLGILAWARAQHGIGTDRRFDPEKLPPWLRHPVAAAVLGVVAPGSSFLTNGGAGRAALAAWNAGLTILAALIVWKARWLWHANAATTYWSLPGSTLEVAFLAAGGIGCLAAFAWLIAILEGVRCGLDDRRSERALRGDVLAFVLLAALGVVYAASEPATLAWDTNETAIALERDGMRRVPLVFARLAQRLDPAHPTYAVHVANLLDACGDTEGAKGVRAVLQARWLEYQRVFAPAVQSDSTLTTSTKPPTANSEDTLGRGAVGDSVGVAPRGGDKRSSLQETTAPNPDPVGAGPEGQGVGQ